MNNPNLNQFGNELVHMDIGVPWPIPFRVLKDLFDVSDDDAIERSAKKFAHRHHCNYKHDVEQGNGIFKRV